jgi:phage protein D
MPTSSPSQAKSADTVAPITIKIDGTALDPAMGNKLVEAVVKKVRVLPDMAHVVLADPVQSLVEKSVAKLGQTLELLAGGPDDAAPKTMFKGVITAIEPEFRDDGVFVGFRAYDRSHAMTRSKHTRTFQDQTIGDMVTAVAGPYFSSFSASGDTGSPFEYMMQSNESDWDFCWRLADLIGFEMVTDGDIGKFRKTGESEGDGPWLQYGQSEKGHRLFSFRPRQSAANLPETISANYVDPTGRVVTASVALSSGRVVTVDKSPSGLAEHGPLQGKGDFAIPNVIAKDEAEMRRLLEAKRDKILGRSVEAEGIAEGDPDLKPGAKVEFRGLGKWNGSYLLSECVHVYRGGSGFRTRFHIAGRPKNLLEAVAPTGGGGTSATSTSQDSIVQGEVTNINDPDSLGRIRVKLPTMTQKSDPEGWWARVTAPSSGAERGLLMLPQVGDKVIVGFENGDTRKPVVLGSVWDGQSKPGDDLVQNDGSFSLKSDSKILMKSAKELQFDTDKSWKSKAQNEVVLENGASDQFTIKSGKEIVLDAPTITLKGGMKVDIKATQVSVNGNATLELKAPSITIGGGQVKLG